MAGPGTKGPAGRGPATPGRDAERAAALGRFEAGDYAQAAPALVALLAHAAPDPETLRACGMALTRTGDARRGLSYLARARRMAPADPLSAMWHGIALQADGRFADAAATLKAAAALAPDDPAILVHLSRALLQTDRAAEAVAASLRAVVLAPALAEATHALRLAELTVVNRASDGDTPPAAADHAAAWVRFGAACLALDSIEEARAAFAQALVLLPGEPEASLSLALVEHVGGLPLHALDRLRDLSRARPDMAAARLHLAGRLLLHGEAEAALRLLDAMAEAIAAQAWLRPRWAASRSDALLRLGRPEQARAALDAAGGAMGDAELLCCRQALQLARRAQAEAALPPLVHRLAQLATVRGAPLLEDRIDAQFLLGDFHDAGGRHGLAFAHWRHGHALLRLAQPFSRARHAALLDAIMQAYPARFFAGSKPGDAADTAPVFIVGLPRTGTTLAEHVLSAHRAVHGAGERTAIRDSLGRLTGAGDLATALGIAAGLEQETLDREARSYLASLHALAPDARVVIDKMPDNLSCLGFIATLLPGARIIWCRRDLRDVGASIYRQRFLGQHPYAHDLADLGWYMQAQERLMRHWQRVLPLPLLELDHADWIGDFPGTLSRVLDFLALPDDAACRSFHTQTRTVRTASAGQVARPINADGVGRWRTYATPLTPMLEALQAEAGDAVSGRPAPRSG